MTVRDRRFGAQFVAGLTRSTPAYAKDPVSPPGRARSFFAALGRRAVATSSAPGSSEDSPVWPDDKMDQPVAADSVIRSGVVDTVRSMPAPRRVVQRSQPAIIAVEFTLAVGLARARVDDLASVGDLASDLDRARDLASVLARNIARARARGRGRALDRAHTLAYDLARARARARARDRDPAYALDRARTLAHDLARVLANGRKLAAILDRGLAAGLDRDLAQFVTVEDRRSLIRDLDLALNDFTGEDLSDADLAGLNLVGVRWSGDTAETRGTRWPLAWLERIEAISVEIEPNVLEIRDGDVHADSSDALVGV